LNPATANTTRGNANYYIKQHAYNLLCLPAEKSSGKLAENNQLKFF